MHKFYLLICLLCIHRFTNGQINQVQQTRQKVDSIILLVKKENDHTKKVALLLSIYSVSIDGFPELLLEAYQRLYTLSQERKDIIIESSAWSLAGQGYRLAGNYVKALECHYKAVTLAERSGEQLLLSYARNQMGHIYKDRGENEKALALYRQAAISNDTTGGFNSHWWAFMNMGAVFLNKGQADSSLYYSRKTLSYFLRGNGETSYTYILYNIGSAFSLLGENDSAWAYFSKAITIATQSQSPRFTNGVYVAIAEHYNRRHQYDSSIAYAKKAVEIVKNSMLSNLALKPARLLADIYQGRNADSALSYWKVYIAANDSLYSMRTNQQLAMMAFEDTQRRKDADAAQLSYRNKIMTSSLVIGLLIFSVIALVLYRNNKQKQKANKLLESTLADLKATQSQLVQSEKMASLGELTAGIAHEIQNPLNFVNNFSEVSNELLDEMKIEFRNGNTHDAFELADQIQENLEKINHHGKRADAIVKGMLQHSRSSSGQKELTDINALCDEYLRLSYHGLRAKDKTFNAKFETNFDNSIEKISVVPQDIGRVILNLINNAFYAANEKQKFVTRNQPPETKPYEPTVSISTKKISNKVEIKVSDNGNGIPQNIIDKIFQPFFTTKPAGEGTGLGLSLSYDIVTKGHSGELKVETKENEGTCFIIILPA